jgi:hypothetical protein
MIDFLGWTGRPIAWSFYRTERAAITASVWQVRRPIYHRSVGAASAKHLDSMLDSFGAWLSRQT